ncbi:MAG: hypothetical protein QW478_13400 [Candidatus Micrarchaeaceae archaeon]
MYNIILLESSDFTKPFNEVIHKTSKFKRIARALLLELSVLAIFTAGIYAGLYGMRAFGKDYFFERSKNFIKNILDDILGKDKAEARRKFQNINAISVVLLVLITIQIWSFYKMSKPTEERLLEIKDINKTVQHFQPYVAKVIRLANEKQYTTNNLINLMIATFIVSKKAFSNESLSDFFSKCVVHLRNRTIKYITIPLVSLLAFFVYFLVKKR